MKNYTFVVLVFMMCFGFHGNISAQPTPQTEATIDSLLSLMTLEEKVDLCHAQSKFSSAGVPRLGIPELWLSDGPHGVRPEMSWDSWAYAGWTNDSTTAFPALTCLAATFNPELSYEYGVALGEEARYRDKDVILGPGVNIYRTPVNGRNFEYMGEDPFLASTLVVPYIKGVQQNGVATCVKHYVLNNQEKWRSHINVEVSDRALYEIYLPAFKAAVLEGGTWTLMGAYNQYRGQHCCHNERLLNDILKKDWGFDGVVVTDWGGAHDTRESALYGLDLEMGTWTDGMANSRKNAYDYYYLANPFLEMIKSGKIDESVVDDKARRLLRLMFRTSLNPNKGWGRMNNSEHLAVARKVGTEGIVLLENKDDFFPLNPETTQTIAIIGENATRMLSVKGGAADLKPKKEVSPLEGIISRFGKAKIVHAMGYASGPSVFGRVEPSTLDADSLKRAAIAVAKAADLVLFVGGLNKSHHQDCENGDRLSLHLPFGQDELLSDILKVNENVGVILASGNAMAMPWLDKAKGVMQVWYLGSETGNAIADIVSGEVSPSGKLPFTFPKKLTDNAAHHFGEQSYPGDSINQEYKEGILVGYRWHDTKNIEPLFPFGFGLSYSDFSMTDVKTNQLTYAATDQIMVTCTLANTGDYDAAEVVQVYIGKPDSAVERATKELKGFKKVFLKKGETTSVNIPIEAKDLSYYNEKESGWTLEKGAYTIFVGNSSRDILETIKVTVE